MRRWQRAQFRQQCGFTSGCWIAVGEPVQVIYWTNEGGVQALAKYRCRHHASDPVDEAQLAADDAQRAAATRERSVGSQPMSASPDALSFDGKAAATGEKP